MNVNNVLLSVAVVCSVASMFASAHTYLRQRDFELKMDRQAKFYSDTYNNLSERVKSNTKQIMLEKSLKMSNEIHERNRKFVNENKEFLKSVGVDIKPE